MNPEEIQAQIDAGIASGMAALNLANDLKITTLMFGLAIAGLIALVLALVVVLVVVVLWGRNQKAANDTSRQAVNTATDLRIEASALRASQSSVLENDAVRSKAMSVLAQGVDLVAVAMERITAAVTTMSKSLVTMDTSVSSLPALATAAQGTDAKVDLIVQAIQSAGVDIRTVNLRLGYMAVDTKSIAQYLVNPTAPNKEDVQTIADAPAGDTVVGRPEPKGTDVIPAAPATPAATPPASEALTLPVTVTLTAAAETPPA